MDIEFSIIGIDPDIAETGNSDLISNVPFHNCETFISYFDAKYRDRWYCNETIGNFVDGVKDEWASLFRLFVQQDRVAQDAIIKNVCSCSCSTPCNMLFIPTLF